MDVIRTIGQSGFDSQGDPEIQVLADSSLYVVFNFMPPSDFEGNDFGPFHDFDVQMSRAIGVPVVWDDRECFHVKAPQADTIERLVAFISTYRSRSNPADRDKFGSRSEGSCFEKKCSADHPFAVGQHVKHFKFGEGEVIDYDGHESDARVRVRFADGAVWWLRVTHVTLSA